MVQWVKNQLQQFGFCRGTGLIPGPGQWIKRTAALLQLLCMLQLWLGFSLRPRNFHMLQGQPKKKKKKFNTQH